MGGLLAIGRREGYTPRPDRADRVRRLITTAIESIYDRPEDGPGADAAD